MRSSTHFVQVGWIFHRLQCLKYKKLKTVLQTNVFNDLLVGQRIFPGVSISINMIQHCTSYHKHPFLKQVYAFRHNFTWLQCVKSNVL